MSTEIAFRLPDGVDQLSSKQKVVAGTLAAGSGLAIAYFVLPPLIVIFTNLLILGGLLATIGVIFTQRRLIWNIYKSISWKLTQAWIGLDTLSAMERYYDWFSAKLEKTTLAKNNLEARLNSLTQQIDKKGKERQDALTRADLLDKEKGKAAEVEVGILLAKASGIEKFIQTLVPVRDTAQENVAYLQEAVLTVGAGKIKLRNDIDINREQLEALKAMFAGMKTASEVLAEDNEMTRMYKESERQLAEKMSLYTAQISQLEENIKPALTNANLDCKLEIENGRKLLEQFRQTNNN